MVFLSLRPSFPVPAEPAHPEREHVRRLLLGLHADVAALAEKGRREEEKEEGLDLGMEGKESTNNLLAEKKEMASTCAEGQVQHQSVNKTHPVATLI